MKFSERVISICKMKMGKGEFIGFEDIDNSLVDNISPKDAVTDFNSMLENEIITYEDDDIHLSALGQHICNMLISPEIYINIDNVLDEVGMKLYIRNAYYLCVLEYQDEISPDGCHYYNFELLPALDMMVSAFVHTLYKKNRPVSPDFNTAVPDFNIYGKAYNESREIFADMMIKGNYHDASMVTYKFFDMTNEEVTEIKDQVSALINQITMWTFDQLKKNTKKEVVTNGSI